MPRKQRNRYRRRFNFGSSQFHNKDAGAERLLFQGQDAACASAQAMHAVALVGDSVTHGQGWCGEGSGATLSGQSPATAQSSAIDNQLSGSQESAKMSVLLEEDLVTKWCSAKQQRGFVEDKDFISYLLFIVSEYETMTGTCVLQPVPTPKSPTKPLTRQASKKRYLHSEADDGGKQRVKRSRKKQAKVPIVKVTPPIPVEVLPAASSNVSPVPAKVLPMQSPEKEHVAETCDDNPLDLSISSHQEDSGDSKNPAQDTISQMQEEPIDMKVTSGLSAEAQDIPPEEVILDFSIKKTSPDANANIADRPVVEERKKREFPCHICGKVFDRISHLKRHKRTHGREQPIPCDVCGEVVQSKAWCQHRKSHEQDQIFSCPEEGCSLAFKDRKLWQDHVSFVHKGQSSVECSWVGCNKTFPRHAQMERHLQTHTPSRMFTCPVCHKAFRHKPNLNVHMRVHSGEAPFKCPHCEYRGRQQSALKWHMKKHHNTLVTSFISFKMDDSSSTVPKPEELIIKPVAEKIWGENSPGSTAIPLVSF